MSGRGLGDSSTANPSDTRAAMTRRGLGVQKIAQSSVPTLKRTPLNIGGMRPESRTLVSSEKRASQTGMTLRRILRGRSRSPDANRSSLTRGHVASIPFSRTPPMKVRRTSPAARSAWRPPTAFPSPTPTACPTSPAPSPRPDTRQLHRFPLGEDMPLTTRDNNPCARLGRVTRRLRAQSVPGSAAARGGSCYIFVGC